METTVRDILSLKEYQKVKVIAGEKGLSRIVNNVYFVEDKNRTIHLQAEVFLIITYHSIVRHKEALDEIVPFLVKNEVSGLAIRSNHLLDKIPQLMLEQADQYDFPILILPVDINPTDLSNTILELLLGKKNSILEFRDELHNKLMKVVLEGADLNKLVLSLSEMIRSPVVLTNQKYQVITSSFAHNEEIKFRNIPKRISDQVQTSDQNLKILVGNKIYGDSQLLANPIHVCEECVGFLLVILENHVCNSNILIAVEQASMLIAFEFQREKAVQEKERDYLDSFVRDIFNMNFKSEYEVQQQAKIFKWDFDLPMILLNIKIVGIEDGEQKIFYPEINEIHLIESFILEKLNLSHRKCKVVLHNDTLVCFISVVLEDNIYERLERVCKLIYQRHKSKNKIAIGISETIHTIQQLSTALEQTKIIIRMSELTTHEEPFIKRYSEIGVYKLIHQINNQDILQEFVNDKLGKVIDNSNKDMDLLQTLVALIKNNLNVQQTAKDLYLHYNTLRYRIIKLKELGISLDDGFEIAELALAYRIYLITKQIMS